MDVTIPFIIPLLKRYLLLSFWVVSFLTSMASSGVLRLKNDHYEIIFDKTNGDIVCIRNLEKRLLPIVSGNGGRGLWILKFRSGKALASQDFFGQDGYAMQYAFEGNHSLRLTYSSPRAMVFIHVTALGKNFDFHMRISGSSEDVLTISLPASVDFMPSAIKRVIFPNELGISLQPEFYVKKEQPVLWTSQQLGPVPLTAVAGLTCLVLPEDGIPVPLTIPRKSRFWMGDSLADVWEKSVHVVSRPIVQAASEVFISSPHGPLFAGFPVGKGSLLCFAGKINLSERKLVLETTGRIVSALLQQGIKSVKTAMKQVVLLDMDHGPLTLGWSEIPVKDWREQLPVCINRTLARNNPFAIVNSVEGLLDKLSDKETAVVVNPYGESFPVGTYGWEKITAAIRKFIERGGIWVTTGGYPFFNELQPSYFMNMLVTYPYAFADFIHLDAVNGTLNLYSIQKDGGGIFMPAVLNTYGDKNGGHAGRSWSAFISKGATFTMPVVRFQLGESVEKGLGMYARANGFTTTLKEKMPGKVLQKWKSSVIYKYAGGTLKDQLQMLDKIPAPGILHLWDFLKGGFDKEYPDILPPNTEKGTSGELKDLMHHARELGHLVMPYTNPTWWGDQPKGTTFKKNGNEALLITLDSQYSREQYGANTGWNISPWHPEVIAAEERKVFDFSHAYPADILFEDQVGARSWVIYDINPASPVPYAYQQGLINLAARAAESKPLATEQGYDRLINVETEFCGLTWQLVPFHTLPGWLDWWLVPYKDQMKKADWQFFPMALYITRGKTFFTHHLGGPMVQNAETLSWTLLLGYQLIEELSPFSLKEQTTIDWLKYISHVQKVISFQYMGKPLTFFHYIQGSGNSAVIESCFGNLRIIANLTDKPYVDGNIHIAPKGFYASSPTADAGILISNDTSSGNKYYWFIKEKRNGKVVETDYTKKMRGRISELHSVLQLNKGLKKTVD
jgi:hypothetical protein